MLNDRAIPGTLLHHVLSHGTSPVWLMTHVFKAKRNCYFSDDGFVDSLRFLLFAENYCNPWSSEFILTSLLTAAF